MKQITPNFPKSFIEAGIDKDNYLSNDGLEVADFSELRQKIAELSCLHPDSVLFFRGQHTDHKRLYGKKGEASTFFPSIYRGNLKTGELLERWNKLEVATQYLVEKLKLLPDSDNEEFGFLKLKKLAQWSILQHYEVVATPLLDVTQSLRVACSFAELGRKSDYAYIYAFAIPYPTGRISINSEHYLTNIRLLSVVPSSVKRPHNQEGYLLGEDEMIKSDKISDEYDFRRRAIAKFKIYLGEGSEFWGLEPYKDRPLLENELYPDKNDNSDSLADICKEIKTTIESISSKTSLSNDKTALFLDLWRNIEAYLFGFQWQVQGDGNPTVLKSLMTLRNYNKDDKSILILTENINNLRIMRNNMVHYSGSNTIDIDKMIYSASMIIEDLESKIPGIKDMANSYQKKKSQQL